MSTDCFSDLYADFSDYHLATLIPQITKMNFVKPQPSRFFPQKFTKTDKIQTTAHILLSASCRIQCDRLQHIWPVTGRSCHFKSIFADTHHLGNVSPWQPLPYYHQYLVNFIKYALSAYFLQQGLFLFICGFGQRVRCLWRNTELTPKNEHVKLITRWKHVPDTIG